MPERAWSLQSTVARRGPGGLAEKKSLCTYRRKETTYIVKRGWWRADRRANGRLKIYKEVENGGLENPVQRHCATLVRTYICEGCVRKEMSFFSSEKVGYIRGDSSGERRVHLTSHHLCLQRREVKGGKSARASYLSSADRHTYPQKKNRSPCASLKPTPDTSSSEATHKSTPQQDGMVHNSARLFRRLQLECLMCTHAHTQKENAHG